MRKKYDTVIIGAGITGAFTAYFLARNNLSVALVDRTGVGNQTSANNPGGLNPLHGPGMPGVMSELATHSFALHLSNQAPIARLSGVDIRVHTISRLELAFDESEFLKLEQARKVYEAAEGFSARLLDRQSLLDVEPRVSSEAVGGLLTEGNGLVDGHSYTDAVGRAAAELGAEIVIGEIRGLRKQDSQVTAVALDSEDLLCESVVVATGPWMLEAEKWLGVSIPVFPLKGELLLANLPGPPFPHHISWKMHGLYKLPELQPGEPVRVWLGGTQQQAGFDAGPTEAGREAIMQAVTRLVPDVKNARLVRHVAAFRPATPDGFPIVGRALGWENVYLASGAGTKGMLIGAGMAESIARTVSGLPQSIPMEHYDPNRFPGSKENADQKND